MELIIIAGIIVFIVWIIWKVRASNRASRKAALDQAWHVVLSDPNYLQRRRYEERMREDETQARNEEGL